MTHFEGDVESLRVFAVTLLSDCCLSTMWYEILPAAFLVIGFTSIPFVAIPSINYLLMGKPVIRGNEESIDKDMYRRDCKLDPTKKGNGLISVYWEGIPDKK